LSDVVHRASAPAKLNLALVVGPRLASGKHDVVTVLQAIDLVDTIEVSPGPHLVVRGFDEDTLVGAALTALRAAAAADRSWAVTITKRIPVKAGLGGGSSDAAIALRLANSTLPQPLPLSVLSKIAAKLGADVPFFLYDSPALATGDGSIVEPLPALPQGLNVLLVLPSGAVKDSTAGVYKRFDARRGEIGYERRQAALLNRARRAQTVAELAALPRNDLVSSQLSARLEALGALRADVSGAGPIVYGLFAERAMAAAARLAVRDIGESWLAAPY
jgi:4-diphosphocytidyl-2-C-methyl-D-erythritol kinase